MGTRLMASGLKARARVFRAAFHMGSLVCRMLNMVSWNVFVASCTHTISVIYLSAEWIGKQGPVLVRRFDCKHMKKETASGHGMHCGMAYAPQRDSSCCWTILWIVHIYHQNTLNLQRALPLKSYTVMVLSAASCTDINLQISAYNGAVHMLERDRERQRTKKPSS